MKREGDLLLVESAYIWTFLRIGRESLELAAFFIHSSEVCLSCTVK
jgi:hypothetical protein